MIYQTYDTYRKALLSNQTTVSATVKSFIDNIEINKDLNVFLEVYAEEALAQAEIVQEKIINGTAGKLAGMVVGIKDVLAYKNHSLQSGSKILDGFKSQFTATAIQRLLDEDAIIIGRQNCDEFAMGSSNENSAFGPTLNFADKTRVPGGSSGASAVAVQANLCHASIGSDTGGSVRQPAGFCGVVGLKPTYSRISRWGLAAYASSFDCIGPITNSIEDAALLLEVMSGSDQYDSTVSQLPVEDYSSVSASEKKYTIGYFEDAINSEGIDYEVKKRTEDKLEELKKAGHTLVPLSFPKMKYLLPTYYILTMAEASSNLSRYDGIRYGYRTPKAANLEDLYKKTRGEGFGKEVKKRIMLGSFILSADYYDAYYTKAQRVRKLVKKETESFFEKVDFIVSPTTPTPAFKIGVKSTDPMEMFLADIFTVHANVVGLPSISIPNGKNANGLPIGFQILGTEFGEKKMLEFALNIQKIN
ncbi:Asp-tRNA(Asn)/Glu-tRNA(Gln) amidotransferase subunit GatA [Lacihabitans sp. CCS-44]|uniref:Asp-tRNA(Asn)/Glu-tRNA(Gln) amidotransferase subunit GatA n=1 Tax=Lacihabitans sp. CCS-44 TaxID=2487331 RepID=UPI002885F719|nr:Asp-tRNA(Asn)/Glu-tRNA(Gln) amidotransferase subunit GatA [Lacihabitans sp. CCS-44]